MPAVIGTVPAVLALPALFWVAVVSGLSLRCWLLRLPVLLLLLVPLPLPVLLLLLVPLPLLILVLQLARSWLRPLPRFLSFPGLLLGRGWRGTLDVLPLGASILM